MISYLTTQMHMPLTKAANTLTNFGGTASLTPLIGAFIADAYAGRFWTITVASIIYQIVKSPSVSHINYNSTTILHLFIFFFEYILLTYVNNRIWLNLLKINNKQFVEYACVVCICIKMKINSIKSTSSSITYFSCRCNFWQLLIFCVVVLLCYADVIREWFAWQYQQYFQN